MANASNEFGTIIGPDASFKGELTFDSAAKILGRLEGSITSKGTIHVADGSTCKATVTAKEVAVEGTIEGNVEATSKLDLRPNGRISGDVVAASMAMAEGASIDGYLKIGTTNGSSGATGRAAQTTEIKPDEEDTTASAPAGRRSAAKK